MYDVHIYTWLFSKTGTTWKVSFLLAVAAVVVEREERLQVRFVSAGTQTSTARTTGLGTLLLILRSQLFLTIKHHHRVITVSTKRILPAVPCLGIVPIQVPNKQSALG
jgi:hypothetical protein